MVKTTTTYWNALHNSNRDKWETIKGSDDKIEQLTLAIDEETGNYTRLTRFKSGADTKSFGAKSHSYPEEILIIKRRMYDEAINQWLKPGDYTSRPHPLPFQVRLRSPHLHGFSNPSQHIDKFVDGELVNLAAHQITDSRLVNTKHVCSFFLIKPLILNILTKCNHQFRTNLQILRHRRIILQRLKYIAVTF